MQSPAAFDHEHVVLDRLDVYRVALEFLSLASRVKPRTAALRDQLDRAASSILLNLSEGIGRSSAADQARCFAIARGSALECVAILDILRAQRVLGEEPHRSGRRLLAREIAMLTRLMRPGLR